MGARLQALKARLKAQGSNCRVLTPTFRAQASKF